MSIVAKDASGKGRLIEKLEQCETDGERILFLQSQADSFRHAHQALANKQKAGNVYHNEEAARLLRTFFGLSQTRVGQLENLELFAVGVRRWIEMDQAIEEEKRNQKT